MKPNPNALRLGYIHDWQSKWFSIKDAPALIARLKIRNLVRNTFRAAAVSWVGIERAGSYLRVNIHTARPGVVIGKKGADIESLRKNVEDMTPRKTYVNVMEIKDPELDSRLVAESIAVQLEKRIAHRRAMRRAMERTDPVRRARHQGHGLRPHQRRRDLAPRVEPRGPRAPAHVRRRRRLRHGGSDDQRRHHRRQGLRSSRSSTS